MKKRKLRLLKILLERKHLDILYANVVSFLFYLKEIHLNLKGEILMNKIQEIKKALNQKYFEREQEIEAI